MQVIEGYRGLGAERRGAAAALGNFDGVHLGHRALIAAARAAGGPTGVVTFEPHPRRFFQPDAPPFRLTTPSEKARQLKACGVQRLHVLAFDHALAGTRPEAFVEDVLVGGLGLRHVVVGRDFRFGKGRAGDAALLERLGAALGLGVSVHRLLGGDQPYSSSAIRQALRTGDCAAAARQLGRWHGVSGRVVEGDRRGRDLGYPTANLDFGEQVIPRFGIYAVDVAVHDGPHRGRHRGVASIGERPTFGRSRPNFEVHLFDFAGDLYGAEITAGLVHFLREEAAFESAEALVRQMDRDAEEARAVLADRRLPASA
ncbi:MAG TPA: bifunctional riboflavin kinase/FAD synthetase [Thermohalobaculum sp.]|nr:bifunctional riboflavin kinase/FAD synthetase [Thermohalobaculum sp.]